MSLTIWKFPLLIMDAQNVMVPDGARCLTVQMHGGLLCLWAIVNPKAPLRPLEIRVYGTGNHMPDDGDRCEYVGTGQQGSDWGTLVWHVFRGVPLPESTTNG